MITHTRRLNIVPGCIPPIIVLNQYDDDFELVFELYASTGDFVIEEGTTARIRGTKSSGTGYSAACTIDVGEYTVTVTGDQQMTAVRGRQEFEIVLTKDSSELNTANFYILVEQAAMSADTITDETVLAEITDFNTQIAAATAAATAAQNAQAAAEAAAEEAQEIVGITVDSAMSSTSTNPVQNKVVNAELSELKEDLDSISAVVEEIPEIRVPEDGTADLYFCDENGNVIAEFSDGHIQTANFDSSDINLETDAVPIENSTNPVQSGGVYDAIAEVSEAIPDESRLAEVKTPEESTADFYIADPDGNVIAQFANGHIETANFDSATALTESDIATLETAISEMTNTVAKASSTLSSTESDVDLDIADSSGNVIMRLADGHIQTANFDSSLTDQNAVKTVNRTAPDANGNVDVTAQIDSDELQTAVDTYLTAHPVVSAACGIVSVDDYGAVGDGVTDDSSAIQDAINANYDVYFESDKTYYIATAITIDHDCRLHGGSNTTIKTRTVDGSMITVFTASGTLKTTTTMTTDYDSDGSTDNSGDQFTLEDMSNVSIGDLLVITATDQYYSYARQYYYLGATLVVGDIYNDHIYTTNSMPWDIALTDAVTVEVYDAPTVIIENLNFIADQESRGHYKYFVCLSKCKNSIVRNCDMTLMDCGIHIENCANTLIDAVSLSKSKYDNSLSGDGYGIYIDSSSNTIVQRMMALCAQSCVCLSGTYPNINTFVRNCDLTSECRLNAIGSHENAYNTVVEDCVLGGLNVLGTATVNRCRFITNNRVTGGTHAISFCGSHNPDYATLRISDCMFDTDRFISVTEPTPQDPIQSFDNIVGVVEIKNCNGGYFNYNGETSEYILSNRIKKLIIDRWENCREIYHPAEDNIIESVEITNTIFTRKYWISDHIDANGLALSNIYRVDYRNSIPLMHKVAVSKPTYGEWMYLPENTVITLSSDNESAQFVVCGENLASNDPDDYIIGSVSATEGGALTRTAASGTIPTITQDADGNIVYTQPNSTTKYYMYPIGMFYVKEKSVVQMSTVLKNTGSTDGAAFSLYIITVDCDTGYVTDKVTVSAVTATSDGATLTRSCEVDENHVVLCCYRCYTPVASSETTFEDMSVAVNSYFAPYTISDAYSARRLTGDGTLLSFKGANNIMCSEATFNVEVQADYINNAML